MTDYDLIVVGAGPAGSTVAKTAAKAGYSVLMLEKKASCISPCAGYVGNTINTELPENCTVQSRITRMRTYFPDMTFHDFPLNGFVVDRPSFDMALAEEARNSGVDIRWDSPLTDLTPDGDGVMFRGGEASGKIIVGADGVFSKTASLLGLSRQDIAVCAQYHLKGIETLENTSEIFFNADYAPGAYAWIYPSGPDSAKVGLGITITSGSRSVHEYLDAFINESEVANRLGGEKTEYMTGALPVGGLRENLCIGNVMLVGDSAGMADPITGAGINNAILAGEVAGKTIVNALENDDLTLLARYERKVRRLLERPLTRSLEKRGWMDTLGTPNEVLQERLPELWVTFKEYWG
jgi:digeranylgeranylglycerophospholipid reductase